MEVMNMNKSASIELSGAELKQEGDVGYPQRVSIEEAKQMLKLVGCKLRHDNAEWIRLLDFCENLECDPGKVMAIQVLDYTDFRFRDVHVGRGLGLAAANRFIRQNLNYDGPIRLAVAA